MAELAVLLWCAQLRADAAVEDTHRNCACRAISVVLSGREPTHYLLQSRNSPKCDFQEATEDRMEG